MIVALPANLADHFNGIDGGTAATRNQVVEACQGRREPPPAAPSRCVARRVEAGADDDTCEHGRLQAEDGGLVLELEVVRLREPQGDGVRRVQGHTSQCSIADAYGISRSR